MEDLSIRKLGRIFPVSRRNIGPKKWQKVLSGFKDDISAENLPVELSSAVKKHKIPEFLPELARLEYVKHYVKKKKITFPEDIPSFTFNPSLELMQFSWQISGMVSGTSAKKGSVPEKGTEWILVWKNGQKNEVNITRASNEDLLALKIISEDLSVEKAARDNAIPISLLEKTLLEASSKGILLKPSSKLKRDIALYPDIDKVPKKFLSTDTFTLQWHVTHACDLNCKHCYDRSKRSPLTPEQASNILDDMKDFVKERAVKGHVCFTGGNPFMYPHFFEVYKEAVERGFSTSILGNPVPVEKLRKMKDIRVPGYFQVSLEGLKEHNDYIRGKEHYERTMKFLDFLREEGISSAVMLTLTRDNIDQIIPLSEELRDRADYFTFNRLSQTGQGADLLLPDKEKYEAFLREYVERSRINPILGFKDNLINIVLDGNGDRLFDGCTGYGCGAAFNFITVLPDGETHACRKFPSPIGNVLEQKISEIYDSDIAEMYRKGASTCSGCRLRHLCGGCMAITNGADKDYFDKRDPYCFIKAKVS